MPVPLDSLGNVMPPPVPREYIERLPREKWAEFWMLFPDFSSERMESLIKRGRLNKRNWYFQYDTDGSERWMSLSQLVHTYRPEPSYTPERHDYTIPAQCLSD